MSAVLIAGGDRNGSNLPLFAIKADYETPSVSVDGGGSSWIDGPAITQPTAPDVRNIVKITVGGAISLTALCNDGTMWQILYITSWGSWYQISEPT